MDGEGWTLITGATGFIGHVLLADLLRRGLRCAVLARSPDAWADLSPKLAELGLDAVAMWELSALKIVQGGLPDSLPERQIGPVDRIVHCAASTRFEADASGEPYRTNDVGTARLLEWAERRGIGELHLVSTAFVCGRKPGLVPEALFPRPPVFRNDYERSKWLAEQYASAWADRTAGSLTVYRPSIVVGEHATGRATRFCGVYRALRAFGAAVSQAKRPLRIQGRAADRLNLIPVDHLSRVIAAVIDEPTRHGAVYHVINPRPPTLGTFVAALEAYHGVRGCQFVEQRDEAFLGERERGFSRSIRELAPYLFDAPEFARDNTARVEAASAGPCPDWSGEVLARLLKFAAAARWGKQKEEPPMVSEPVARFFEVFLPAQVPKSALAGLPWLTTTFRFIVDGHPNGEWVCSFEEGRLARVRRGAERGGEHFVYRMGVGAFWDIVGAKVDPQEVFLSGRAEVSGDYEQALKFGMVLTQFNREHPYRPADAA
jgi:nucleoside-diphosphate-sugar epimerase